MATVGCAAVGRHNVISNGRQTEVINRALGKTQGLVSSALDLGRMDMTFAYGPAEADESVATIHRAPHAAPTSNRTSRQCK